MGETFDKSGHPDYNSEWQKRTIKILDSHASSLSAL
jgi:hypothetical protein